MTSKELVKELEEAKMALVKAVGIYSLSLAVLTSDEIDAAVDDWYKMDNSNLIVPTLDCIRLMDKALSNANE